ncbi:MAG: cytochrome c peroxidase [Planctomycetaceae bacterium]
MKSLWILTSVLIGWSRITAGAWGAEPVDVTGTAHARRPVAAALCDDGRLLVVVNQRSGSVSLIDADSCTVTGEFKLGDRLSDVAALPGGKTLLITDEARHELLLVRPMADGVEVIDRITTPRSPVNVAASDDGRHVAVAGLWSHRVALLNLDITDLKSQISTPDTRKSTLNSERSQLNSEVADAGSRAGARNIRVVRLPFAPRMQTFVPGEELRLVVADAFGGGVAVVHAETAEIESVRELPAHNIRGLAVSEDGDRLLVSHQVLGPHAHTDFDDVHWGSLMQNIVRDLSLSAVLDPQAELLDGGRRIRLGQTGNAAADPAGIAIFQGVNPSRIDAGPLVVALSGVNEVLTITSLTQRDPVGARPLDVVWDEHRRRAYVVCSLDDAVAVVDSDAEEPVTQISLGPQPEPTPRERGERLFYDGHRSHDGWLSCHSCHTDGHTNGGLADTLSDGSYGTPKQVPSLLGSRDANPWAWNGQFRELHTQVGASYASTLHGDPLSLPQVNDVVAFLHTLEPPPPVDEGEWTADDRRQIERGRELFFSLGCKHCHVPPVTYTIDTTFDVGVHDEAGLTKFNPPSLRGLSQRRRFLHDGRAASLEAVFTEHAHQLERALSPDELEPLLAFLQSL